MKKFLVLAIGAILALAPTAFAQQIAGGNIYGTVTDESGAVLPGANVTLTGETGTRSTTSGPQGTFRFINLNRGDYTLAIALSGFSKLTRNVRVTTGENVEIPVALKVSSLQETVEVVSETPLVDSKKRGTATTMTNEELNMVPNARDPWGVMAAVPGVVVDRVNIAGSENGQQAAVAGKGTTSDDKVWNMDGLIITDMSATGASPTYFDFDAFQEITVATGGNDLQVQSGGIGINMVTKRGTNVFHGGGRFLLAHHDASRSNLPSGLENDSRLQGSDTGNAIQQISDYGFDIGGPIFKDKLWFYFTYGKQDIRLKTYIQTPDKTLLGSYNAKLNWQPTTGTTVSAFWFIGDKQKFGRSAGFPLNAEDGFNWDQKNAFEDKVGGPSRPHGLWKLQVDHTFSPNFFMSVNGAYYNTGFTLTPRGGLEQAYTLDYVTGDAIGSYQDYTAVRPQWHFNANGNYFFSGTGGNHELKFGFGYRDYKTTSISHYGGDALAGIINSETEKIAYVWRDGVTPYAGKYINAYLGDVFTKDRLTLNLGVRWDGQKAKNLPSEVGANPALPNVVPGLSYAGDSDYPLDWSDFSPRAGMSLALDASRRTVLRASYAYYADQLAFGDVTTHNPIAYGYLAYGWNDLNADRFVQPGEVNLNDFQYSFNMDPDDPTALVSPDKIDRNLKPKHDHEFVIGIDRELGANFAVGLAYTWRKANDWQYTPRLRGACGAGEPTLANCPIIRPDEYTQNAPTTANGFTAFTNSPPADLVSASGSGRIRTNAPGYSTTFNGIELTLVKRLSNKWMARVAFSYNDWKENWDGQPYSLGSDDGNPTRTETDPLENGGPVAVLSGGSGKASFYTVVPWQLYANGLYQLPWGIDVSGALFAKKGGPYPVSLRLATGADGTNPALATGSIDEFHYNDLFNLDLRLAKTFKIKRAGLTFSAEWFNVLNNDLVLSRYRYANNASFTNTSQGAEPGLGRVEEVIAPSILRFGARLTF
jgi:Carboxypeptidase regulatory-like domain/TonB-dependent Receptor Plug Domain